MKGLSNPNLDEIYSEYSLAAADDLIRSLDAVGQRSRHGIHVDAPKSHLLVLSSLVPVIIFGIIGMYVCIL